MLLLIDDRLLIEDIQERFNDCFPSLKIEFYSKWGNDRRNFSEEYLIDSKARLRNIRHLHTNSLYEIKSWDTVEKIERDLRKIYGLNAQIFRHENDNWLSAHSADHWTLQEHSNLSQNAQKRQASKKAEVAEEYELL